MIILICKQCGNEYKEKPYRKDTSLYCSRKCYGLSERGKIPKSAWKTGQYISPATQFKKGELHPYFGKSSPVLGKRWKLTGKARENHVAGQKGKPRYSVRGDKHWNWKGGISSTLRHMLMSRIEYKVWRKSVFDRDDYICQTCHIRGGKLNADHIKPYAVYPELAFNLSNGRTLCETCHRKTDTFGGRATRQE